MKDKDKKKYVFLPNEFHRKERWSGGRIHKSKKTYNRKIKHNKNYTREDFS